MRILNYSLIHAMIAGLSLAIPASAQQALSWQLREGEGKIFLAYEIPETSTQNLLLVCDNQSRHFSVHYHDDRDRVRDGTHTNIIFDSEGGQATLSAKAERQELGDEIVLEAETPLDANLVSVLSGQTLRVTLADATQSIPLEGARAGVAALVSGCGKN